MRSPAINDPLERATTCIDCVKPHGKKNVPNPIARGVKVLCSIFLKKLNMPEGSVILFLENTPIRLSPSKSITIDAAKPSIAVNVKLIPIAFPTAPRTPPSRAKLTNLPIWKRTKFFLSLTLSCDTLAERERTSPPTIARQVETEAMSPMIKLVTGVVAPPNPRLRTPD
jgi:hypothetical protein